MDFTLVYPELLLTAFVFVVLGADLFVPRGQKQALGLVSAALLLLTLLYAAAQTGLGQLYGGIYVVDTYTHFFRLFFVATTLLVVLLSLDYVRLRLRYPGEYYGMLLLAGLAMVLMAGAGELITAYISLELLNFSLYTLTAYAKDDARSNEAGVKYILLSILASALLLYGLSYIYGAVGTTYYDGIARALQAQGGASNAGLLAGLALVTAGLGFKVAAVPFHMWTPDVYEGAPTPITAYIAVASKAAGFALLLRLFGTAFLPAVASWAPLMALLAALTMTLGNLVAIQQRNVKRLLAYSSISQVGYLLMGVAAISQLSASAILFHLAGYAAANLAAFSCVIAYQNLTNQEEIEQYAGMAQRAPFMAFGLAVALFSLSGMPLFAGFTTKFYLFIAAAAQGYLWLVALATVNSLISLYYYLKLVRQMYIAAPAEPARLPVPALATGALTLLVVLTFAIGLYPAPLLAVIDVAVRALGLPL
ncbi:MAG: NADH-quinone oxidoreductase subunit N [Chloroflexi bacterium]|nr:NADH-quinone oxidoreductase subunit N [Chloroflexota bacterium]